MRQSLLLAALISSLPLLATPAQVAVGKLSLTAPSVTGGWVAYVDLSAGRVQPVVTPSAAAQCGYSPAVTLLDTRTFAARNGTFVAITANAGLALNQYVAGTCESTVDGLLVSGGTVVNPPQWNGPVLYFPSSTRAVVTSGSLPPLSTILAAVAGSNSLGTDCPGKWPGTLLVSNGIPGACALPAPYIRAPRGAAGVDRSGKVLILAIVQGVEHASGLQTAELAQLMIALGAWNAVNLDGGGSTAFVWTGANAPAEQVALRRLARPSSNGIVQYTVDWKAPGGSYVTSSCDTCSVYRAVYAGVGLKGSSPRR